MWLRWNLSTHIYEKSDDDGQNWVPLPLDAAILTEGTIDVDRLPTNLAQVVAQLFDHKGEFIFDTPGDHVFYIPQLSQVTSIYVECWGAGGASNSQSNTNSRAGAGGGAYSAKTIAVSAGQAYDFHVGLGPPGNLGDTSAQGETSWFDSLTTVSAEGGNGLAGAGNGQGGLAANGFGDVKFSGGNGGDRQAISTAGGGGGESGGPNGDGNNGANGAGGIGGAGGSGRSSAGDGGAGGNTSASGEAGKIPGGGGGGKGGGNTSAVSGAGANGRVRITWTL
jgi:hypothetical protein